MVSHQRVILNEIQNAIADASRHDQAATCVFLAERWLRDHPDDLWVTHRYAEMLYKMTRYDEAIRVYTDAIEKFGDHRWGIYNQLGHLFRYRGNFPEAENWYRKAADEDPDEAASFIFLGSVQARQGNLKAAEASHRRATTCTAGCIDEAFHNLGLVLRGQGRFTEAAECFRKAIEVDPEYKDAVEALEDVTRVVGLLADVDG
jgi:tetratricopeptide (TPR) repeat protein